MQRPGHPGGAGRPRAAAAPAGGFFCRDCFTGPFRHCISYSLDDGKRCVGLAPGVVQPCRLCALQGILETLAQATLAYGRRNVRMLYDALSTLAEAVGRGEWQRFGAECTL